MTTYAVNPCRSTADTHAMIAFYQALGLRVRAATADDGFALLKAGDGWVGVRAASDGGVGVAPGESQLLLLTRSVDAAADDLRARGLDVRAGEAGGVRHLAVASPSGAELWITETHTDLDGYQTHDDPVTTSLVVLGVVYSDDFARDQEFFSHFGLEPVGEASEHWVVLDGRRGRIGLHAPDAVRAAPRSGVCTVDLGFETPEPLADIVHRLKLSGFDDARLEEDGPLTAVHVTDPDGRPLQIHPLTR